MLSFRTLYFRRLVLLAVVLAFQSPFRGRAEDATGGPDWKAALPGWVYNFPADHAIHPAFKTEWWYFTGNLHDQQGRTLGYELTFFRQGVVPPGILGQSLPVNGQRSRFVQGDFKFAHFAISDLAGRKFYYTQRISRGAFGDAGFSGDKLAWIDDWHLQSQADGSWQIEAHSNSPAPMALDLRVQPLKPPVIHGAEGVSQKAVGEGNASHYYSFTRLATKGTVALGENAAASEVHGESWFDHEWASNQLAADQVGWDWFCFQLDDETELMLYAMRKRDGSVDPVSAGTFIAADGRAEHLRRDEFQLQPLRNWKSAQTGAVYPLGWKVTIPGRALELTVETKLDNQELVLPPISYWEGAIQITGQHAGKPVTGSGYMELTGYAGALKGLQKQATADAGLHRTPR